MITNIAHQFDPQQVASAFSNAAANYDQVASLQQQVGCYLLTKLNAATIQSDTVLDLGAGTGYFTDLLAEQCIAKQIVVLDFAYQMLEQAKWRTRSVAAEFICADANCLPLASQSINLIFSNLMLQWCANLKSVFQEWKRILKPQGHIFFSTLGEKTLHELRDCWAQIDNYTHVHDFHDTKMLHLLLKERDFGIVVLEKQIFTQYYATVYDIMRDLKILGASNKASDRRRGLMGKECYQQLAYAYEFYRNAEGLLPVTYEVIFGYVR